jgi:hypothetical protein
MNGKTTHDNAEAFDIGLLFFLSLFYVDMVQWFNIYFDLPQHTKSTFSTETSANHDLYQELPFVFKLWFIRKNYKNFPKDNLDPFQIKANQYYCENIYISLLILSVRL